MKMSLAALFLLASACGQQPAPKDEKLSIAAQEFRLELAVTPKKIEHGMMGRKEVGDHEGMLFIFPQAKARQFWMKNCLVALDVVFVDSDGRVVSITTMTPPEPGTRDEDLPTYSSHWPAQFAIELRAGRAEELNLKAGDKLDWPLERLKKYAR